MEEQIHRFKTDGLFITILKFSDENNIKKEWLVEEGKRIAGPARSGLHNLKFTPTRVITSFHPDSGYGLGQVGLSLLFFPFALFGKRT